MSRMLTLPEALIKAGLQVAYAPGWEKRGLSSGPIVPEGVMCHHTGINRVDLVSPGLNTVIKGRGPPSALRGPLCHWHLNRVGLWTAVATGRANHAGGGQWDGVHDGNSRYIGIEAENNGIGEPWNAKIMEAYIHGVATMLTHIGKPVKRCCGHKEYAEPHGRKSDPTFDMIGFRTNVSLAMHGIMPPPIQIPPADVTGRPTLREGRNNDKSAVKLLQKALKIEADGVFGPATTKAVRAFQRAHDLVPDAIVGPKTWSFIDQALKA